MRRDTVARCCGTNTRCLHIQACILVVVFFRVDLQQRRTDCARAARYTKRGASLACATSKLRQQPLEQWRRIKRRRQRLRHHEVAEATRGCERDVVELVVVVAKPGVPLA